MIGIAVGIIFYLVFINLYKYAFTKNKTKNLFLIISLLFSFVVMFFGIILFNSYSDKEYLSTTLIVSDLFIIEKLLREA